MPATAVPSDVDPLDTDVEDTGPFAGLDDDVNG